jgi:hypothetical protein
MSYSLSGDFIETCDCTVICPCWVDEDPVGGHCTGLIAWHLEKGSRICGHDVGGCTVVSISTHAGNRRDGDNTTTMLYIQTADADAAIVESKDAETTFSDTGTAPVDAPESPSAVVDAGGTGPAPAGAQETEPLEARQFRWLTEAFSGRMEGPLAELAEVSGTVVGSKRARISIGAGAAKNSWRIKVNPLTPGRQDADQPCAVEAEGHPQVFDEADGNQQPLTLRHTALSHELGHGPQNQGQPIPEEVVAQKGDRLFVNVGALPAGHLDVFDRSGMRGYFRYFQSSNAGARQPRDVETHS